MKGLTGGNANAQIAPGANANGGNISARSGYVGDGGHLLNQGTDDYGYPNNNNAINRSNTMLNNGSNVIHRNNDSGY